MKIYTRTGDEGLTSVIGARLTKDSIRIEAIGTIDELNSVIGLAVSNMEEARYSDMRADLVQIQHELFDCGADLAHVEKGESETLNDQYRIGLQHAERLERWIDRYTEQIVPLTHFILPGGSTMAAQLHMSRAVCRRAERRVVALAREEDANRHIRIYLNRLSDLLFTMARAANVRENVTDTAYRS